LHPEFPAQVKGKLATDKKEIANLIRSTFEKLVTKRNSAFFDDWFKLAESYRIRLTHRKKTGKIAKVHGLVDCASRDNIHTELFLIEGDSAGGSLMKSRDKNLHAVLPLRGKLLNVAHKKATKDKILTNDVITNISAAVGFKPFTAIDPSSCRYGRVNIMADADPDGKHINCLLITLFYRLFPELIKDGRIYLMVPPLYGVHIKNQFIPIYTEEEMASYRSNHNTMRYKGLGEMSADEIYYCAFEQNTRRAIRLEYEDFDINKLWKDELGILPNVAYVEV
jgi:DNA gyrase/topoisomerase IV subunit B